MFEQTFGRCFPGDCREQNLFGRYAHWYRLHLNVNFGMKAVPFMHEAVGKLHFLCVWRWPIG